MANPALRQRGQDIEIVLFDGSAAFVKGVVRNAETSAGESTQPFGDFGPIAWLDFDGDGQQIEFVSYADVASGDRLHRRKIKAERLGTVFPAMKVHLSGVATVMPRPPAVFDRRSFSGADFNVG